MLLTLVVSSRAWTSCFYLGHIFPFQKPVFRHSQYRRWVSIANPNERGAWLTSCSCETLRFPRGEGTCPLFKTPRAVVLPMPWILLTVTQPDITWSDNKWGITSLYCGTVWPMSIGCIFCDRGTIMISAEIPRECLKWQNTYICVITSYMNYSIGFFRRAFNNMLNYECICFLVAIPESCILFRLRVDCAHFEWLSSKPETMTYCFPDKNCLTGSHKWAVTGLMSCTLFRVTFRDTDTGSLVGLLSTDEVCD